MLKAMERALELEVDRRVREEVARQKEVLLREVKEQKAALERQVQELKVVLAHLSERAKEEKNQPLWSVTIWDYQGGDIRAFEVCEAKSKQLVEEYYRLRRVPVEVEPLTVTRNLEEYIAKHKPASDED